MINCIGHIIGLLIVVAIIFLTYVTWTLIGRFFPNSSYALRGMFCGIAYSIWVGIFLLLLYIPAAYSGDEGEFSMGAAFILIYAGFPTSLLALFVTKIYGNLTILIMSVNCFINSSILGLLFGFLLNSYKTK